jgi:hypothetical protein
MFCVFVSGLTSALPYLLLLYQQRFNKRFSRRLKRKPVTERNEYKYCFRAKQQWVIDAVIYLKVFMPDAGVRSIANMFNRIYGHRETVSKSFVAKVLRDSQYAVEVQRRDMRNRGGRPSSKQITQTNPVGLQDNPFGLQDNPVVTDWQGN